MSGLFDVLGFMAFELTRFMKEEGRYRGRVKSFLDTMDRAQSEFGRDVTWDDIDRFDIVLGTVRSAIYTEFRHLGRRHLSPADRTVVVARKILETMEGLDPENEWGYHRQMGSFRKVIDQLYDNIRLRGKYDHLQGLVDSIVKSVANGTTGRYPADDLRLWDIAYPAPKVKTLDSPKTVFRKSAPGKEVDL